MSQQSRDYWVGTAISIGGLALLVGAVVLMFMWAR
jgi:hypothetical protein